MRPKEKGPVEYKLIRIKNMLIKNSASTHHTLLRDLAEITAVLDVESQMMRALVALANVRRAFAA